MNEFGIKALRYWEVYRPQALTRIGTPQEVEVYFTNLGTAIQQRAAELKLAMASQAPISEDYDEQVGYLNQAHASATQQALEELAYLQPEPGREHLEMPRV
jgi:hypothetical protein